MMIYQQPECESSDNPFTISDLLNVQHDFPESPYVYFGNSEDTVICIVSPFNPADQWCSAKPPDWTPPEFWCPTTHVVLPPPNNWQPPVVTPEPAYVVFMLAVLLLAVLAKARRWCRR